MSYGFKEFSYEIKDISYVSLAWGYGINSLCYEIKDCCYISVTFQTNCFKAFSVIMAQKYLFF